MPARRSRRYLRFVVGAERQPIHTLCGLIRHDLTDRVGTHMLEHERTLWKETLRWFSKHLAVPPYSTSPKLGHRAVCWLRDDAHECIRQMRVLAYLLGEAGVPTRILEESNPGRIVWQDEHQVVVVPWRRPRH